MKKAICLPIILGLLAASFVMRGTNPRLSPKDIGWNKVLTGKVNPIEEGWSVLRLDTVNARDSISNGRLRLKAVNEDVYSQLGWYQLFEDGYRPNPEKGYTLELKAKIRRSKDYGSFTLQGFDRSGMGFRIGIFNDSIVETTNSLSAGNILQQKVDNTDSLHTFRCAVTPGQQVHVYRDMKLIGTFPMLEYMPDNIIANGGFEEDSRNNFFSLSRMSRTTKPAQVLEGQAAAYFRSAGYDGFHHRDIPVKPNTIYNLSLFYRKQGGSGWHYYDFRLDDKPLLYGVMSSTYYRKLSKPIQTPNSIQVLKINFPCNGDALTYLDNFTLTEGLPTKHDNLIPNGNFEDDVLPDWGTVRFDTLQKNAHAGKKSMTLNDTLNARFLDYGFDLEPDMSYTLSFWVKSNLDSVHLILKNGKKVLYDLCIKDSIYSEWTKIVKSFTTTASDHRLAWSTDTIRGSLNLPQDTISELPDDTIPIIPKDSLTAQADSLKPAPDSLSPVSRDTLNPPSLPTLHLDDVQLRIQTTPSYLFFGKSTGTGASEVEIESVSYDLTGAYAPVLTNKPELLNLIEQGDTLLLNTKAGFGNGAAPPYAFDFLRTVLDTAKIVLGDSLTTFELVEAASARLVEANHRFLCSINTEDSVFLKSVHLKADTISIREGLGLQTTLTASLSNDSILDLRRAKIVYTSDNDSVATFREGWIQSFRSGQTKLRVAVTLNDSTLEDSLSINVSPYRIASLQFLVFDSIVALGEATGTSLSIRMNDSTLLSPEKASIRYDFSMPGVLQVNDYGSLLARAKGKTKVTINVGYKDSTVVDSAKVEVVALESIRIQDLPEEKMLEGDSARFTVWGLLSDSSLVDLTRKALFSKTDNESLALSNLGNLKAYQEGNLWISAFVRMAGEEKHDTARIWVEKPLISVIEKTVQLGKNLSLYPNPVTDVVRLYCSETIQQITLTDAAGKPVKLPTKPELRENQATWRLSGLPSGFYILHVNQWSTSLLKK